MANLRDELLKNMLKIQKDIIKKESAAIIPKQAEKKINSSPKKLDPFTPHHAPRTIKCRYCGRDVLKNLLDKHNQELHPRTIQNKEASTHNKNTTTRTSIIDAQDVTYKRTIVVNTEEN